MPEKIAIVGSRAEMRQRGVITFEEREAADERDAARREAIKAFVASLPDDTEIVNGCEKHGADAWAKEAAERNGLELALFPAAWEDRHGNMRPSAGPRRNRRMAKYADRVVAFFGAGKSDGTRNCCEEFDKRGKPIDARDHEGKPVDWRSK